MPTMESTYEIKEREDGALVAYVERALGPSQVGVAMPHPAGNGWLTILWDEQAQSAEFTAHAAGSRCDEKAREAVRQLLEFHAAIIARLVAAVEK